MAQYLSIKSHYINMKQETKLSKAKQLYVRSYKGKQYTSYNRAMLNDLIISLKRNNK